MTSTIESSVEIPYQKLSTDTLDEVVKEFILREGTDDEETESSFKQKKDHLLARIRSGQAKIVFDHQTESCSLVMS